MFAVVNIKTGLPKPFDDDVDSLFLRGELD